VAALRHATIVPGYIPGSRRSIRKRLTLPLVAIALVLAGCPSLERNAVPPLFIEIEASEQPRGQQRNGGLARDVRIYIVTSGYI